MFFRLQGHGHLNTGDGRVREVERSDYVLTEFVRILEEAESHYATTAIRYVVKIWAAPGR